MVDFKYSEEDRLNILRCFEGRHLSTDLINMIASLPHAGPELAREFGALDPDTFLINRLQFEANSTIRQYLGKVQINRNAQSALLDKARKQALELAETIITARKSEIFLGCEYDEPLNAMTNNEGERVGVIHILKALISRIDGMTEKVGQADLDPAEAHLETKSDRPREEMCFRLLGIYCHETGKFPGMSDGPASRFLIAAWNPIASHVHATDAEVKITFLTKDSAASIARNWRQIGAEAT